MPVWLAVVYALDRGKARVRQISQADISEQNHSQNLDINNFRFVHNTIPPYQYGSALLPPQACTAPYSRINFIYTFTNIFKPVPPRHKQSGIAVSISAKYMSTTIIV